MPTSNPTAAETARLDRGDHVRAILLDALETAYSDDHHWPTTLADGGLAYIRPTTLPADLDDSRWIAPATVVLHERLGDYADGAWVGYADGHLEFVTDTAGLADAVSQLPLARKSAQGFHEAMAASTRPAPSTLPTAGAIHFQVFDPSGKPVANATVGQYANFGDWFVKQSARGFQFDDDAGQHFQGTTDADGRGTVEGKWLFGTKFYNRVAAPMFVYSKDAKLMGFIEVPNADLTSGNNLTIVVQPMCHVEGRVTTLDQRGSGKGLECTLATAALPDQRGYYTIDTASHGDHFSLDLPPGDWTLEVYGDGTLSIRRQVHISPGRRTLNLQIDLPPTRATALIGQPAPELQKIKAWKNGGPTTLAQLRGKVVLLEFWGYWCGPCVGSMPDLFKLHDDLKDKGLVIIGVHSDSAETMAEIDRKCEPFKQQYWGGRDLPFLIALDGGGPTRVKYEARSSEGATCAAYGIEGWPTTVVIDRNGRVAYVGDPRDEKLRPMLESLLAEPTTRP